MGSLASRPKIPDSISQVQQSAAPPEPDPAVLKQEREDTSSRERARSLLSRNRGRYGTIRTGFRGLSDLAPNTNIDRKRLLGE